MTSKSDSIIKHVKSVIEQTETNIKNTTNTNIYIHQSNSSNGYIILIIIAACVIFFALTCLLISKITICIYKKFHKEERSLAMEFSDSVRSKKRNRDSVASRTSQSSFLPSYFSRGQSVRSCKSEGHGSRSEV